MLGVPVAKTLLVMGTSKIVSTVIDMAVLVFVSRSAHMASTSMKK